MSSSSTAIVPIENSLLKKQTISTIIKKVIDKLSEIDNLKSLKGDLELLKYICSLVSNLVKPKHKLLPQDVESIITNILITIFQLEQSEIIQIKETIKFLQENKLIKKLGHFEKSFSRTISYLKKKFA